MELFKQIKKRLAASPAGGVAFAGKALLHGRRVRAQIETELTDRLDDRPTKWQIRWCFWDYLGFLLRYRGSLEADYFGAQMYRKSGFVRHESFATGVRWAWRDAVSERGYWKVFYDKCEMYPVFSEFLNRKWMVVREDTPRRDIEAFSAACAGQLVSKIPNSGCGKGVRSWEVTDGETLRSLCDYCAGNRTVILEEMLRQCEELCAFSKGDTVNTVRIVTVVDEGGEPHVASAVFRMSRGDSFVDNFNSGGVAAPIDIETGIVAAPAIDKLGRTYLVHPDSGRQIVGYVISDWEGYKRFARTLARKVPMVRYVGWDIVKDEHGRYCMIEGNKNASADLMESGSLHGLLPVYNKYLHMGSERHP